MAPAGGGESEGWSVLRLRLLLLLLLPLLWTVDGLSPGTSALLLELGLLTYDGGWWDGSLWMVGTGGWPGQAYTQQQEQLVIHQRGGRGHGRAQKSMRPRVIPARHLHNTIGFISSNMAPGPHDLLGRCSSNVEDIEELSVPEERLPASSQGVVIKGRRRKRAREMEGGGGGVQGETGQGMGEEESLALGSTYAGQDRSEGKAVGGRGEAKQVVPPVGGVDEEEHDCKEGGIPGTQRIWLKTFGCSHNVSDSEYMEGVLASYGYTFVDQGEREQADLWLINSCTVKNPSQSAFTNLVGKAQADGYPVVVAGCVPQADRKLKDLEGVSMVGVQQIDRVLEAVEETLKGRTVRMLGKKGLPSLDLPKIRRNPLVEIVPLSTGCSGSCTYCKTKHARGELGSYAVSAILDRIRTVTQQDGVTEVWLSSEDTGAYGRDIGTSIANLLRSVRPILPPDVMLRVGMTNPPYILEHLHAVAETLNHPNVYSFLHVPVQAGSDPVLEGMNREYTVAEFKQVVDYLHSHVPGCTIATDIICGFPGETEAQFQETLDLMSHYQLAIVNISQFYPRPGTPAAKMEKLATHVVKDRSRRMTKLLYSFDPYPGLVGTTQKVWINTEFSGDGKHSVGHTKAYVKVLVLRDDKLQGSVANVLITSCSRFHVEGTVLDWHTVPSHKAALEAARLARSSSGWKEKARVHKAGGGDGGGEKESPCSCSSGEGTEVSGGCSGGGGGGGEASKEGAPACGGEAACGCGNDEHPPPLQGSEDKSDGEGTAVRGSGRALFVMAAILDKADRVLVGSGRWSGLLLGSAAALVCVCGSMLYLRGSSSGGGGGRGGGRLG